MAKTGLAFSGGGIRSAALCSGVLRRLLQKNVKIDYLSCVSGGGYTGTAYLDWKYRNGKKDDKEWHEEFFNHMRQSAGFICHCNKPLFQAILDFLAIIGYTICVYSCTGIKLVGIFISVGLRCRLAIWGHP